MGATDSTDPFAIFTQPPPNETAEQRQARLAREAEEKRVSDKIDEQIKQDRAAMKKKDKTTVKVLLLGQSESGKSTTLKNFRLKYARAAWKAERQSWRSVIQLNLIRTVLTILDALQAEADGDPLPPFPTSSLQLQAYPYNFAPNAGGHQSRPSTDTQDSVGSIEKPEEAVEASAGPRIQLGEHHLVLRRRLGPLRRVEQDLKRRLGAGTDEVVYDGTSTGAFGGSSGGVLEESTNRSPKEFGVHGWKSVFTSTPPGQHSKLAEEVIDEATEIIAQCREDMIALWEDRTVKEVLKRRRMRIEDAAGFFLNDLDRIATRSYEPSDDDVVRARLRTLGVQEHRIQFDQSVQNTGSGSGFLGNIGLGPDFGHEWILYDVGGSRTTRHAWFPYFEDVNAVIFLAPISCFDERLLEDPSVNRLEDSFILWHAVCSNKLLAKATMILFLNKCDILKRKLRAGIQVKNFLPSYGERPNEPSAVVKYLKDKFKDTLRQQSPEPRTSYFYATSVTDTRATATTLKTVRDSILREHLKNADLIM